MDVSAVDLGEFLVATLAIVWLARVKVNSYVGYGTVEHRVYFLAGQAGESLAQPTRLLVENVTTL